MEKLKPMTDFILEQSKIINDPEILARLLVSYATFLKQPLTLEMFIPLDLEDNVLDSYFYNQFHTGHLVSDEEFKEVEKYQEAKSRVIFEGFEIDLNFSDLIMHKKGFGFNINELSRLSIEKICNDGYDLVLTETAKKKIGL